MADVDAALYSSRVRRSTSYRARLRGGSHAGGGGVTFSFETPSEEEPRPSLDACALCRRPLLASRDIFMYRGDTPFCSEECRQEQMDLDETQEREMRYRRRRQHLRAAPGKLAPPPVAEQGLYAPASNAVVAS